MRLGRPRRRRGLGAPRRRGRVRRRRGAAANAEISFLLTDDAGVRDLNRDWRGKDKATNVLSFPAPAQPGAPGPKLSATSSSLTKPSRAKRRKKAKTLARPRRPSHVHGTLHLLGYDHEGEEQAEIMEDLEVKALASLGVADPYRDTAALSRR